MERFFTFVERRWHRFTDLPAIPTPRDGPHGLAVVCIARSEERYIREWIAFHRLVGARHIYIYVNEDTSAMRALTADSRREGAVTLIPWENFSTLATPQPAAYAHALANFGPRYRWMAFIDVDEFLFPAEGDSLLDALADFEDLPGLSIPWHMFGTSGHLYPPDALVLESYTQRAPFPPDRKASPLLQYKSIVDPCRIASVKNGHWFYLPNGERAAFNERRQKITFVTERLPSHAFGDVFRLNHYFTRSAADVEAKIARGRIDRPSVAARASAGFKGRTQGIWRLVEQSPVEDTAIQRFLPTLRRALDSDDFMPAPGTADAGKERDLPSSRRKPPSPPHIGRRPAGTPPR